jgi:hypothetical protein
MRTRTAGAVGATWPDTAVALDIQYPFAERNALAPANEGDPPSTMTGNDDQ